MAKTAAFSRQAGRSGRLARTIRLGRSVLAPVVVTLLLALGLVFVSVSPAAACSCSGEPMTDYPDEVSLAFTGRQVERVVEDERDDYGVRSVFQVERVYKGDIGPTVEVWTSFDGGMCGIDPGPGRVHVAASEWNGKQTMGLCGSVVTKDDLVSTFGTGGPPDLALGVPVDEVDSDGNSDSDGDEASPGSNTFPIIAGLAGVVLVGLGLMQWYRTGEQAN